jgi:AcrR family transcriptional regulator
MPTSTRRRLIEAAARRFYRDGFRNVGIDQVLSDVGISKTAFYKHFASKDDLVLAALEAQHQALQDQFRQRIAERGGTSPVEQLHSLFDVVEGIVEVEEFHGCIFVNVALEFPLPHEPAHQAAARNKQAIEQLVVDLGRQAGAADPRALAQELCLIMEGAYVTRHVTGNPETMAVARRLADRVIAAHVAP